MTETRCVRCGSSWTGLSAAHCAAPGCHRTFTSISAFDLHQKGAEKLVCKEPSECGLVAKSRAWGIVWGWPGMNETAQEARRG